MELDDFYFDCIDLGAGIRQLRVDLSDDAFDPIDYDQSRYDGYAEKLIQSLRDIDPCEDLPKDSNAFFYKKALAVDSIPDAKKTEEDNDSPGISPITSPSSSPNLPGSN